MSSSSSYHGKVTYHSSPCSQKWAKAGKSRSTFDFLWQLVAQTPSYLLHQLPTWVDPHAAESPQPLPGSRSSKGSWCKARTCSYHVSRADWPCSFGAGPHLGPFYLRRRNSRPRCRASSHTANFTTTRNYYPPTLRGALDGFNRRRG